jgi:hypothetical protein
MVSFALFFGCASKESSESMSIEQTIINTQKARLVLEDNSTLLISATYLNNIKKYSANELDTVVLIVYYSKNGDVEIKEPNITFGTKTAHVATLSTDDEIIKYLPIQNKWSRYFLASVPKTSEDYLNLSVEIYPFEKVLLRFQKDL